MYHISPNITNNLHGVTKQTRKLTSQDSKPRRANYVLIFLNVPTAEVNTKPT